MAGPSIGKLLGIHMYDLPLKAATKEFFQRINASLITYAAGSLFVKLSLFLLYLRLFRPNKVTRWLIIGGMIACTIAYPAVIIISCVLCVPPPARANEDLAWLVKSAQCAYGLTRVGVFLGAFGPVSDIYLLVLPFQAVMGLYMPLRRKLGVSAVFSTGVV